MQYQLIVVDVHINDKHWVFILLSQLTTALPVPDLMLVQP